MNEEQKLTSEESERKEEGGTRARERQKIRLTHVAGGLEFVVTEAEEGFESLLIPALLHKPSS